jgi:hypothetical protein
MKPATMETGTLPKLELLRIMMLSREGDRREGILMRQGKGWFQVPAMGHEALAAIVYHLRPDDLIFPTYRDRAIMLARGMHPTPDGARFSGAHWFQFRRAQHAGSLLQPGTECVRLCHAHWLAVPTCCWGSVGTQNGRWRPSSAVRYWRRCHTTR